MKIKGFTVVNCNTQGCEFTGGLSPRVTLSSPPAHVRSKSSKVVVYRFRDINVLNYRKWLCFPTPPLFDVALGETR